MTISIAINIVLGVLALAAVLGLSLWAIATAGGDRIGRIADRRRAERRRRAVPEFPVGAERRRSERRYGRAAAA